MGQDTSIEWCDATWNPVRGCSRVSPGCENCYAEKVAGRFSGPGLAYEGLARMKVTPSAAEASRTGASPTLTVIRSEARWTGKVRMVPEHLADPLRWTKPRRIFVNSMSDLFHEKLDRRDIAACFGVMALASHHTYQVLTKRAERMRDIMSTLTLEECFAALPDDVGPITGTKSKRIADQMRANGIDPLDSALERFPLPWIWLGVSVEDQANARRIDDLLRTPAAVRFVSYEPALGPLDGSRFIRPKAIVDGYRQVQEKFPGGGPMPAHLAAPGVDWVIVGGESGPGARPFDLDWARSVVAQCAAADVACFVKQLGADPRVEGIDVPVRLRLKSKKGGDMQEWPEDLRVREFPEARR